MKIIVQAFMGGNEVKRKNGKKVFGLVAIGSAIAALAGCAFKSHENAPEAIYGPPSDFDSSYNENIEIYGPPEMFDPDYENPEEIDEEDFDPSSNENAEIYGPPEAFEENED